MTICKKCRSYRHLVANVSAPQVWYNHFCAAPEVAIPESFNFVTGEKIPASYPYCRDVNRDGECKFYVGKLAANHLKEKTE